jgi:hypothetical protein
VRNAFMLYAPFVRKARPARMPHTLFVTVGCGVGGRSAAMSDDAKVRARGLRARKPIATLSGEGLQSTDQYDGILGAELLTTSSSIWISRAADLFGAEWCLSATVRVRHERPLRDRRRR